MFRDEMQWVSDVRKPCTAQGCLHVERRAVSKEVTHKHM